MTAERKGPLESRPWPSTLEAMAVDEQGGEHRLHGYAVESDLAKHYRFSDAILLALTGELPEDRVSAAFEVAMIFLLPLSVARAPAHAGVLAGFVSSPPSGVVATAAVTLAEDAVRVHELVEEAEAAGGELPLDSRAATDGDRVAVEQLRARLAGVLDVPILERGPNRDVALVAVLRACGLRTALQIASAVAIARLSSVVAEAAPRATQSFVEKYPLDTPPFRYAAE